MLKRLPYSYWLDGGIIYGVEFLNWPSINSLLFNEIIRAKTNDSFDERKDILQRLHIPD